MGQTPHLHFQSAVSRSLSVAFQSHGRWEGHDYRVEVVAARQGLDGFDVVVDFRDLEAALDQALADPTALAERLLAQLTPFVAPPAQLVEVALTDGQGRRLAVRP